ncbi:MAG: hypothetical protein EA338_12855 [Roseinatronobacter sp.]|nr:MAG: hypothetical protein EA338_12855 [Roseinatronobacter sp.]
MLAAAAGAAAGAVPIMGAKVRQPVAAVVGRRRHSGLLAGVEAPQATMAPTGPLQFLARKAAAAVVPGPMHLEGMGAQAAQAPSPDYQSRMPVAEVLRMAALGQVKTKQEGAETNLNRAEMGS